MKSLIYYSVIAAVTFCSCSNPRYINSPSAYNPSFFRQKGDMKFSGSVSVNPSTFNRDFSSTDNDEDNSIGFDGQAGFALSDHFLIEFGGMYRQETDYFSDDDLSTTSLASRVDYKRSLFNVGLGFYAPMGRLGSNYFNMVFDGAIGKMTSTDDADPYSALRHRKYDADLLKLSLKPAFNFFFSDAFRMSVAPRFAVLKLNNISTTYTTVEEQTLGYHTAHDEFLPLFEPSLHLQVGPQSAKWVKFDFGFNFATNPLKTSSDETPIVSETYDLYSRGFLFTFGLSFYPFEVRRR